MESLTCAQCGALFTPRSRQQRKYCTPHCSDERNLARIKENQQWLRDLKASLGCIWCGERTPDDLEFHHRDKETKRKEVGGMVTCSRSVILDEIDKCDVVCKSCHRRIHRTDQSVQEDTPAYA